jgi:UDPglucose--hexose-1-phosphate uridylyltransferase
VPEVRIDPLTGLRAIVAGDRARRPGGELRAPPAPTLDPETDPFAEGHEDRTPPEVYAVRPSGGGPDGPGWTVRVVPNLYPALSENSDAPAPEANPDLFWAGPAHGAHEVIINAPDPVTSLSQLGPEQVAAAMDVWRERMRTHRDAAYVHLIVNEQREAGASLPHTHAQVYALDFVPAQVARERERIVAIDEETVLMAPYGARLPYQLLIAPRTPRARFEDEGPTGAHMVHDALCRLARQLGSSPPLNMWVRTAPRGAEHFCWRIDIVPRLTHLAGLELGAGVHLNIVPPELVAEQLRAA